MFPGKQEAQLNISLNLSNTMAQQKLFDAGLKKIGLVRVDNETVLQINSDEYKSYIKVLYLPKGYRLKVDFKFYSTERPSLFFISPN